MDKYKRIRDSWAQSLLNRTKLSKAQRAAMDLLVVTGVGYLTTGKSSTNRFGVVYINRVVARNLADAFNLVTIENNYVVRLIPSEGAVAK